jgi:predicted dehydrogenase
MAIAHPTGKVRIGIVGAGFAARFHVENYRRVYGVEVEVRGVAAGHPERAVEFAERHDLGRAYESAEALIADPEADLVDVCTPPHLHGPFAIAAAEAGKHVAIEKPLTGFFGPPDWTGDRPFGESVDRATMLKGALENADAIVEAARAAGVKLCYAENWCYAPGVQKADRLLAAGDSVILRIDGEESHSGTHSEPNKHWVTAGGGTLMSKGVHPLGGALLLKYREGQRRGGRPIRAVSVTAEVANQSRLPLFEATAHRWLKRDNEDVENWGAMLITFEDGSVAQITGSDIVLGGSRRLMTVFSSSAVVQVTINQPDPVVAFAPDPSVFEGEYITEKIETTAGWIRPSPDEAWFAGYPAQFQDFCEAVALDREPVSGPLLARDTVAIIYGAYLSAEQGRRVDLRPYVGT